MRHTPIILASAALLTACGPDSGNPMETTLTRTAASVAGVYDLTEVNSDPLPYTHPEFGTVIEEGSLTLTADGRFTYSVTRSGTENGEAYRVTVGYEGIYAVRGQELHLIHDGSAWRQVASFRQGGIIVPSDPYWYLFVAE